MSACLPFGSTGAFNAVVYFFDAGCNSLLARTESWGTLDRLSCWVNVPPPKARLDFLHVVINGAMLHAIHPLNPSKVLRIRPSHSMPWTRLR